MEIKIKQYHKIQYVTMYPAGLLSTAEHRTRSIAHIGMLKAGNFPSHNLLDSTEPSVI